jgi:hypothetical protein
MWSADAGCAGDTFRPPDAAEGMFHLLFDHLRQPRERGLSRLDEGRIMKNQRGGLDAGPCDLTDAGRQALERDRRLWASAVTPLPVGQA